MIIAGGIVLTALSMHPTKAAEASLQIRVSSGNAARIQPFYAEKLGIFSRLGLKVENTTGLQGAASMRAVDAGQFDIGYADIVSIAVAINRGEPYVILALGSVYTSDKAFTILAQASTSNFQSGKDLEGKRVATPTPNDLGQLGVRAWVDAHGGDSSKVIFVHGIPVPEVPAALAEHRVDASETTEPQWTSQLKEGKVKLLAKNFDAIAPRFVNGAFFARREWVESHRDAARLFTQAMSETAQWARVHPDEAIELSSEVMKAPKSQVEFRARVPLGEGLQPELLQPVFDVAARYGMIAPIRAQDLFIAQ